MTPTGPLLEVLGKAQSLRFLGPGDPAEHLAHAIGFADAAVAELGGPPDRACDLGTGGGVPGLVLAYLWEAARVGLVESSARRSAALEEFSRELGLADRVEVLHGRAEFWAHEAAHRETYQLVTARSFARPAITAEIASGLVRVGGVVIVSDPPDAPAERWPEDRLASLRLGPARPRVEQGVHFSCFFKIAPADPGIPRSEGRPAKKPLW